MRKIILIPLTLFLALWVTAVHGEISTNLKTRTEKEPHTGRVESVTYVDDEGNPMIAGDKGYATVRYSLSGGGKIRTTDFLDTEGNLVNCTDGYSTKVCVYSAQKLAETTYFNADGEPALGPEGYARQVNKRNPAGKLESTWEYDTEGNPVNTHYIAEFYTGESIGRLKNESWYDADGHLTPGPKGYARAEYAYAGKTVTRIAYYNEYGEPYYYKKDGFAVKDIDYERGAIRELRYYGEDGGLIAGPNGYARATYQYEDNGATCLTMFYNADGSLFFTEKGYCGIKQTKGVKGRIIDETYYVGENERGYSTDGYSRVSRTYTKRGKVYVQRYYDAEDHLMVVPELGYAKVQNDYSGTRLLSCQYYDAEGNPVNCAEGYAVLRNRYENKILVEKGFYAADGRTPVNGKDGYARIVYINNANGQCVSEKYFDADGNPFIIGNNADEIRYTWNGKYKISTSYWANGEPVTGDEGYHEIRLEYSGDGKVTAKTYYGTDGNPMMLEKEYARTETLYNSSGKAMATLYYDSEGRLITTPGKEYAYVLTISQRDRNSLNGIWEEEPEETDSVSDEEPSDEEEDEETDEPGEEEADGEREDDGGTSSDRIIYVEYYGTDGKLMNLEAGYAYLIRELDENGNTVREAYYDAEGNKAVLPNGYHSFTQEIGEDGLPASTAYFGIAGEPVTNTKAKCHRIERTYLDKNHITSEAWFDENGMPVTTGDTYVRIEREFDGNKNPVREITFDGDGKKIARKDGYDEVRRVYNEENRAIRIAYYLDGEPVLLKNGYAALEREYDENGNVTFERYLDGNFEPVLHKQGYGQIRKEYNEKKQVVLEAHFDTDGTPMTFPKNTYYAVRREYDDQGLAAYEQYLDADLQPTNCKQGYCAIRKEYQGKNRVVYEAHFDTAGQPMPFKDDVYYAVRREYDDEGRVSVVKYLDEKDEPMNCAAGYEMIWMRYNDQKQVNYETYMDHTGMPVPNIYGVSQTAYDYDEKGHVIRERYFDGDGNPVRNDDGFYGMERTYGEDGKLAEETGITEEIP